MARDVVNRYTSLLPGDWRSGDLHCGAHAALSPVLLLLLPPALVRCPATAELRAYSTGWLCLLLIQQQRRWCRRQGQVTGSGLDLEPETEVTKLRRARRM
jgi:hypothetical protein